MWISEDVDCDEHGDRWALGTFRGYHDTGDTQRDDDRIEGVDAAEAIAWGKARADTVLIRAGEGPHLSAGTHQAPDADPWPPGGPEPLIRRRVESHRWKDRTETDPPITSSVTWAAVPPPSTDLAAARDDLVSSAHEAVGAGIEVSTWSLDTRIADTAAARGQGFATHGAPVPHLTLQVDAPTATTAIETSRPGIALPEGWQLGSGHAEPTTDA